MIDRELIHFIVHCSATPNGRDIRASNIKRWHVEDNGWSDNGYHYIICIDGTIELGRPIERAGAHVAGKNANSVGVCLIGTDNFNDKQLQALKNLFTTYKSFYPSIKPSGHRDWTDAKTCPNMDAKGFLS